MASGGTDLSTSMSAVDQNIGNKDIKEIALEYFKKYKVEISDAINTSFPFLERLRDHGFITEEKYEESQESFKKRLSVQEVIYDILTELEKTFDLSLLGALFSKVIMKKYRDLYPIYKIFTNVIPGIKRFPESDVEENKEMPDTHLSLEQGAGENSYQRLTWLSPDSTIHNGPAPPENGLSEHLCETEQINVRETDMISDNIDALENQHANERCAQESEPAGVELPNHGNQFNSCSVHPVNINKEKPSSSSGADWEAQGRTDCNQAPDITVISSEDSAEFNNGDEVPEASTSTGKRKIGTARLGSISTSAKAKRKRRRRKHTNGSVNFRAEILPVTCGEMMGMLIKRKLERGPMVKCIRRDDGKWFTPREFEIAGGYRKSSNWKTSVCCGGRTLKWLIENEHLPKPPGKYGWKKKLRNSEKCKICRDAGKLFRCTICLSFYHKDCHIPPVEAERTRGRCTFCTTKKPTRSQQCYSMSEILARQMGPEEKLKCEFLLLKAYYHLEGVFRAIAHENYVEKASKCLEKLKILDQIKKSLIQGDYPKVEGFFLNMFGTFEDPSCNDSDLTKEKFMKNFKEVFAIRKTN